MKKITLLLLLTTFYSNAQIQTEDFEAVTLPTGWTSNVVSGSIDWTFGTSIMPTGTDFSSNAAIFDDDAAGGSELNNTVQLLSPAIDVTSYSTLSLDFEYAMQAYVTSGTLTVEVWDGNAWQQILFVDVDTDPTAGTFDVTQYKNAAFQVKYTYEDGQDWAWGAGIDTFSLSGTLSTNSFVKSKFSVYPNPTSDIVNINSNSEITNIVITNVEGRVVKKFNNNTRKVDVSDLNSGLYFLTYDNDGNHYLNKIEKK